MVPQLSSVRSIAGDTGKRAGKYYGGGAACELGVEPPAASLCRRPFPGSGGKDVSFTHWASALPKEVGQPKDGEHPTLFVVPTYETAEKAKWTDMDIAIAETRMALAAAAEGIGSCILANIERDPIREALGIPASKEIATVVAFGYPTHASHIVDVKGGDVKYYLDEKKDYCVPKRSREELFHII